MTIANKVKALAARTTMSKDDVRSLLMKDHKEALELTEKMQKATQARTRKSFLAKLKPALTAHSRAEEKVVYGALLALKKPKEPQDMANEGFVEHSLVDELLEGLAATNAASDMWKAKAKVLNELLSHHVDEEQSDIFAELGEYFDSEELAAMGTRFLADKAAILRGRTKRKVPSKLRNAKKKAA